MVEVRETSACGAFPWVGSGIFILVDELGVIEEERKCCRCGE